MRSEFTRVPHGKNGWNFTFGVKKIVLAGQDFSTFDDSNLTTIMNGPGSRMKLDEVANVFPKEFRFPDVSVKTTANYDLK